MINELSTQDTQIQGSYAAGYTVPTLSKHQPQVQAQPTEEDFHEADSIEIKDTVDKLNKKLESTGTNLKFDYHKKLNQITVALVNPQTNEVIREIPSKKYLDLVAALMEGAGLILNRKG